jgi:hypothetical protein
MVRATTLLQVATPSLPVSLPTTPVVSVPVGFHSRSVVVQQEPSGEVVVRNRRSWQAVGAVLAPQAFFLPQLLKPVPGQPWMLWLACALLVVTVGLAVSVGRTGGLVRLWLGPRSWGRRGLVRSRVFAPAVAATAEWSRTSKAYRVRVTDSRGASVHLATVYEQESAMALATMLHAYAAGGKVAQQPTLPPRPDS